MPPKANDNKRESVKVSVRLRPMSQDEISKGFEKIVEIDQENASVRIRNPQGQYLSFTYDYSFPEDCTQEEVYEATAAPIVSGVLEGYNGTIFAYGQTGTGKTYSMDGKPTGDQRGIMPRAFDHIFEYIAANSDSHEFLVTVTYVEIYNDQLRDLLSPNHDQALKIREDPAHGVQLKGVTVHKVKDVDEINGLLNYGKKNRVVRKTNMNAESSRSHSIFTIVVETLTKIDGQDHVRSARLNLVDLAGSERVAKTGAEGQGFKEGVNINYELMILGNCIAALTSKGTTHIPYRDSKLTMLLRDSLGGNARTMMIAALGPASYNFSETMSTLRYAERAKKIENKPKVNMDPKDALLLKLKEELAELESKLAQKDQLDAQMGASDDVIAMMEAKLEEQRAEMAKASNMVQKEKDELLKKMEKRRLEIEKEKKKREGYQKKLDELSKILATSDKSQLMARTAQNESAIREAKEKLRIREEKSKKLQMEMEERRKKREQFEAQVASLQKDVGDIQSEFKEYVAQYKNLKLMEPEIQKTIQADREQLAHDIDYLTKELDLYTQIVENFIPVGEVDRIKSTAVFDTEKSEWELQSMSKKKMVELVLSLDRPKSAIGAIRPTAKSSKIFKKNPDDPFEKPIPPLPVQSRIKKGPTLVNLRQININYAVENALESNAQDEVYLDEKSRDIKQESIQENQIEDDFIEE